MRQDGPHGSATFADYPVRGLDDAEIEQRADPPLLTDDDGDARGVALPDEYAALAALDPLCEEEGYLLVLSADRFAHPDGPAEPSGEVRGAVLGGDVSKSRSPGIHGAAFRALGSSGGIFVSFGKYTAFPHGSSTPQRLKEGDVVLMDGGCSVDGYQSDITRTFVFGKPTDRQRQIWDLERKAQDAGFAAARVGAPCEAVDAAARKVITDAGFGPDYKVPGLPHRTGHGIGLDGHEWTNFVRGNKTPIQPGMCFSDEPTVVIYGEFGIRLEDCLYITPDGPKFFTKQSASIACPPADIRHSARSRSGAVSATKTRSELETPTYSR